MCQAKENMLFLQLETREISDPEILESFENIDREDFMPPQFKRISYSDIEIKHNNRVVLRCYVLGMIVKILKELNPKNILIVGDLTGYTSSVCSNIFDNCTLATIFFEELSEIRMRVKNIPIMQFETIISNQQNKFDAIFFDSGFYKKSTIKQFYNLLSDDGKIIYFSKIETPELSEKVFDFINVLVKCLSKSDEKTLFEMPMMFSNKFVI